MGQASSAARTRGSSPGNGKYTDDLKLPGMLHAVFVRSPHAHARIRSIDTRGARGAPGVVAVFTGKDLADAASTASRRLAAARAEDPGPPRRSPIDRVRYVGEPVAVVIAETAYGARDAAELVERRLRAAARRSTDTERARSAGRRRRSHDDAPDNVASTGRSASGATDAAFERGAMVVKQRIVNQRLVANRDGAARRRGALRPRTDELRSGSPPRTRTCTGCSWAPSCSAFPEHKVRVIAPDVGGGFGSKIFLYPEEVVVAWARQELERPIKWTATRRESFSTDAHGRDHVTDAEMALDDDGKLLGLRVKTDREPGRLSLALRAGDPDLPLRHAAHRAVQHPRDPLRGHGVFTNTTPVDAYRGAGRPEACYLARAHDGPAARSSSAWTRPRSAGRTSSRRRVPVPDRRSALAYDSGNYAPALDRALEMVGLHAAPRGAGRGRAAGPLPRHRPLDATSRPAASRRRRSSARSARRPGSRRARRCACTRPAR